MPYCTNCKTEYRADIAACSDCGAALVSDMEESPSIDDCREGDTPAFLCSVSDSIEAEITVSLLQSNDIPVMKKRREGGEYLKIYMGMSFYDMDLYVPSKLLERANEIIAAEPDMVRAGITEDGFNNFEKRESVKRHVIIWVILGIPVLAVITGMLIKLFFGMG